MPVVGPTIDAPPKVRAEICLLLLLYAVYSLTRVLVDAQPDAARSAGEWLLAVERRVGLDVETATVDWLVRSTALSVGASYAYAVLHYTITPLTLLWLYKVHPQHYRRLRTVLVLATSLALLAYWLLPTAPPRLLADPYPDVLAMTSQYGWWGAEASAPRGLGSLTNQYAAMPSMHVGWATWSGLAVMSVTRGRRRGLALTYPLLIALVVVATGNHYVLDAVAGAAVVAVLMLLAAARAEHHRRNPPTQSRRPT